MVEEGQDGILRKADHTTSSRLLFTGFLRNGRLNQTDNTLAGFSAC